MDSSTRQEEKKGNNPDGKGGFGDHPEHINPGGEPKNSLKNYIAKKLAAMSDEEKDEWLETHDIKGEVQWKMGEGNPANNTDITSGGKPLILPSTLIDKNDTTPDTGASGSK